MTVGERKDIEPHLLQGGQYGIWDGLWYGVPPHTELLAGFGDGTTNHKVVEHLDGTITVSPSILVSRGQPDEWHGYLEQGVWRKC